MIHTLLGERTSERDAALFRASRRQPLPHLRDFVQAMEDASNVDLSLTALVFAEQRTGVTVKDDYNTEAEQYTLTIANTSANG